MNTFNLSTLQGILPAEAPSKQRVALNLLDQVQDFFQANPTVDVLGFEDKVLLQLPELVGRAFANNEWVDSLSNGSGLDDALADLQVSLNTDLGNLSYTDRQWCLSQMFYPDPAGEYPLMMAATTLGDCFRQVMGENAWAQFKAGENQEHLEGVLPSSNQVPRPRM